MKCEMSDCAEKFNGSTTAILGGYRIFRVSSNNLLHQDHSRKRKWKVCIKCAHRPVKELIELVIKRPLSHEEIEKIGQDNIMLSINKPADDQF